MIRITSGWSIVNAPSFCNEYTSVSWCSLVLLHSLQLGKWSDFGLVCCSSWFSGLGFVLVTPESISQCVAELLL